MSNIVENLSGNPWRSSIPAKQGDRYLVAGGRSHGIRVGDRFTVMQPGAQVKNPQNGLIIQLPGTPSPI
ncbi:MAG: hypothetical protein H7831_15170 [Magnetococcus sp. WYHC-3]